MNPRLAAALSVVVTVLTPMVLVLLAVRLLLTPLSPGIEYGMPGFPADLYGFTLRDRLRWSDYSVRYLLNSAGTEYLSDLRFDDGTPVFNERELSHMHDVKAVVQGALTALYVALALLIALGLYAWFGGWRATFLAGLRRGGWLTVGVIAGLGALALVSFGNFFTLFHEVFFKGDSWLFEYSDTLIRLFPIRFWQDVFLFVLGFALMAGLLLGLFAKPRRISENSGKV
jgi:integral membrane protein (TIGR01906 family)